MDGKRMVLIIMIIVLVSITAVYIAMQATISNVEDESGMEHVINDDRSDNYLTLYY